jgi:hypothetical protein
MRCVQDLGGLQTTPPLGGPDKPRQNESPLAVQCELLTRMEHPGVLFDHYSPPDWVAPRPVLVSVAQDE